MDQKNKTVLALEALCEREGGYRTVAIKAGITPNNLWQVLNGVRLPVSGNPRGMGPGTLRKLDIAFPGWIEIAPSEPVGTTKSQLSPLALLLAQAFDDLPDERRIRLEAWRECDQILAKRTRPLAEQVGDQHDDDSL